MDRGDILHVYLNPVQGREQAGARYVLIVSPKAFNMLGTPLVCPVTQGGTLPGTLASQFLLVALERLRKALCYATSLA